MPDEIFFLGDVFGYYYDYRECILFLKKHKIKCILGNHDKIARDILLGETVNLKELVTKYGCGYNQILGLRDFYLEYLCNLETRCEVVFDECNILLIHGSPDDDINGRIYPDTNLIDVDLKKFNFCFCGHTHHRSINVLEKSTFINVGSLGQPRDGMNPCFVLFNTVSRNLRYIDLPLDKVYCYNQITKNEDLNKSYTSILTRTIFNDSLQ